MQGLFPLQIDQKLQNNVLFPFRWWDYFDHVKPRLTASPLVKEVSSQVIRLEDDKHASSQQMDTSMQIEMETNAQCGKLV